jgi:large subunit ribosomal protein L30
MAEQAQLKVTQIKSTIGAKQNQRDSLRTLGLRGIRKSVIREDNPTNRGLINAVRHLVTVEEVAGSAAAKGGTA